jgi:hypothetical protein
MNEDLEQPVPLTCYEKKLLNNLTAIDKFKRIGRAE